MPQNWIIDLAYWSLTWVADVLRSASDWLHLRLVETRGQVDAMRNTVFDWLWWFFHDIIPDWIPGRDWVYIALANLAGWMFEQPRRILNMGIDWFWSQRDWGWGEWIWVARILNFRNGLKLALEGLWRDLQEWTGAALQGVRDWVGANLRALIDGVSAALQGVRDWTWAAIQGVRDWMGAALRSLMDWMGAAIQGVRDWVGAALQGVRDWAIAAIESRLGPIRDWIRNVQSAIDWVRHVSHQLQIFLDDPLGYLWARWERHLWPTVESWLVHVWDGAW